MHLSILSSVFPVKFQLRGFVPLTPEQEGHDGPEIAHLSLLTKHAPSSFPVT